MTTYRLYTFVNVYLSSIQQGIQTQHVASDLYNKYVLDPDPDDLDRTTVLKTWSRFHKTTIVLNGGTYETIGDLARLLEELDDASECWYPWATFSEDNRSLGGLLTSAAIVLPDSIYDAKRYNDFFGRSGASTAQLQKHGRIAATSEVSDGWFFGDPNGDYLFYPKDSVIAKLLSVMKACPLAR